MRLEDMILAAQKESAGGKLTEAARRAEREGRRIIRDGDGYFGTYIAEKPVSGEPYARLLCAYCDEKAHNSICAHLVN